MDLWDIPGYEGVYAVDRNTNQVWSYPRTVRSVTSKTGFRILKGKFMKPYTSRHGYYYVGLRKDGVYQRFLLHRLIYASRHPEFDLYDRETKIDHVEHDKTDNENLRECSNSQNQMNRHSQNKLGHRYIKHTPSGTFGVRILHPDTGKQYAKTFKTLEEAITHRNEMLPEIKGDQMEYLPKDYLMEVYGKDFT
jgi:hypothetical protein